VQPGWPGRIQGNPYGANGTNGTDDADASYGFSAPTTHMAKNCEPPPYA
jgi:hypothetical protein